MVTELTIRAAWDADWEAMTAAFVGAGRAAWGHLLAPDVLATLSPPERWQPSRAFASLVAEQRGSVVGFVCARPSGDADATSAVGEIDALYVAPACWGLGAGRRLLAAGLASLRAGGFGEATLWTEERNERPRRFYAAAGWRLDGTVRRRMFRGCELVELRHRRAVD